MQTRRQVLRGGLAAVAWGLAARRGFGKGPPNHSLCIGSGASPLNESNPFLHIPNHPPSMLVDGLPFADWFTGDDFQNNAIPFHFIDDYAAFPPAQEDVDVAIVGGGISGLSAGFLLKKYKPIIFDVRPRFGGNAMGEIWHGIPYNLGSAYVIVPDEGSFLERFYQRLGLDEIARVSEPPDPVVINGQIRDDFYSGAGASPADQLAFQRYAEVVTHMAEEAYPEIPLPDDPVDAQWVRELDNKSFRQDIEERMGMPMPTLLAAAVQAYCYSSFAEGFEELSAASGWNFLAAEEYGRWVFPGGNGALVHALWKKLKHLEDDVPHQCRPRHLRSGCQVVDVRYSGNRVQVAYLDAGRQLRTILAKHVVMAGSKHVAKYVLHDLQNLDIDKYEAMMQVQTNAYVVANVLLTVPIQQSFYDAFLVENEQFPVDTGGLQTQLGVVDMLHGSYAVPGQPPRSVLSLYWPLPFSTGRFTLMTEKPWNDYALKFARQIRRILTILNVPVSAVRQVRMTRWGHAVPIAQMGQIWNGTADHLIRPLGSQVHFANQDNWLLPAVENSILEARRVAQVIKADLG